MTTATSHRSIVKHGFAQTGGKRRHAMALVARHAAMRPGEEETRGGMIEPGDVVPRLQVVTGEASRGRAVFCGSHPLLELALVRIAVAPGTGEVRETILHRLRPVRATPVAVSAGDRSVCVLEREARLVVACQRETCRAPALDRVTALTAVLIAPRTASCAPSSMST